MALLAASRLLPLLLLLLVPRPTAAQTAHDTTAVCEKWFALFVEHYDSAGGVCYDRSGGERGDLIENETGDVAACLFRTHCITRLVGLTDAAIEHSPPPLFNLSTINDARLRARIEAGYCSGARTINQLFQRSARGAEQESLGVVSGLKSLARARAVSLAVPIAAPRSRRFCASSASQAPVCPTRPRFAAALGRWPPLCACATVALTVASALCSADKLANETTFSDWCNVASPCNALLDDYARFCVAAGSGLDMWESEWRRARGARRAARRGAAC